MKQKTLALLLVAGAFAVSLHQYVTWGKWFEVSDIHHEMFIVALAFAGLVVYLVGGKGHEV